MSNITTLGRFVRLAIRPTALVAALKLRYHVIDLRGKGLSPLNRRV